jgi:NDP-mannose synthase
MKAIILAGGKGTRLAPYTRIFPKPMMPIGDKAILEILLHQMQGAGVTDVVITVGHLAGLMRAFFQDGGQYGLKITYSHEETPLGTAGPLALVPGLTAPFLVTNGDLLTTLDITDLVAFHQDQGDALATIATHDRKVHIDLGVIETDARHTITHYIEKPDIDYQVSMGIYVLDPAVLGYIPQGEYMDFPDLVRALIADGQRVAAYPFEGYYQDLGNPDDYEQACQDFDHLRPQLLAKE